MFSTPKTRRMHLIQGHGYPKEYFFAVTNKGVGGLLKRWGEGVSMLRKPWKPRENGAGATHDRDSDEGEEDENEDEDEESAPKMEQIPEEPEPSVNRAEGSGHSDEDEDQVLFEKIQIPVREPTPNPAPRDNIQKGREKANGKGKEKANGGGPADAGVDALTRGMDSLSLVPTSIQFGRGAKRGALQGARGRGVRGGHARRGSGGRGAASVAPMEVDHQTHGPSRGYGRALPRIPRGGAMRAMARGRGRGSTR